MSPSWWPGLTNIAWGNHDGLQGLRRCYHKNLNILTWPIMTEWECKLGPCLQSTPSLSFSHARTCTNAHAYACPPLQYLCMWKGSLRGCHQVFNSAIHHGFPFGVCAGVYCKKEKKRREKKGWKQTPVASMSGRQMERRTETQRHWVRALVK